jgi:hypothetical protein
LDQKKHWKAKKLAFPESFRGWGAESKNRQIKFILTVRGLGKGGVGVVTVSHTLVQDYASGRRHLPLPTFAEYTPSPSLSIDVQWR